MNKKEENNIFIVDDIQNIYSCIVHKSNKLFLLQQILLFSITCLVSVCHWLFLFINVKKLFRIKLSSFKYRFDYR